MAMTAFALSLQERRASLERLVVSAINTNSRSLKELMNLTGLKRTQMQLMISELKDANLSHAKHRSAGFVEYCPGPAPNRPSKRKPVQLPVNFEDEVREFDVHHINVDGNPMHRIVRFGDHYRPAHALTNGVTGYSGGSSLNYGE